MRGSKISFIAFFLVFSFVTFEAFAGPAGCDGEVGSGTTKASGELLIAFGFGYSAAGFLEAGEPIKAHNLRELTDPISKAEEAERLFATFAKADLPARLVKFDKALRQADYISLYKEFNAKGEWMPQTVWNDVAHKAINQGVRGLMDL